MKISSAPLTDRSPVGKAWIVVAILFFAGMITLERVHTYDEAIDRDLAGYAIIGHEMLRGRELYSDLWERKPPLLYITFAAAEKLVGFGKSEIFLLNLTAALATLLGIYFAGSAAGSGRAGGLFAAGIWVLIGGDLLTQANQPNAEVFVNLFMTAAFALLVRLPARIGTPWLRPLIIGGLFTAATLYKHHAILACVAIAVGYVFGPQFSPDEAAAWRLRLRASGLMMLVVMVGWLTVFGYFAAVGRLSDFIDTMFTQAASYAGSYADNVRSAFNPVFIFRPLMGWAIWPFVLVVTAALVAIARNRMGWRMWMVPTKWWLWALWIFASWIMVAIPGKYIQHYYQLLIPAACVGAGWAASSLVRRESSPGRNFSWALRAVVVTGALTALSWRQLIVYRLPSSQWSALAFPSVRYFNNDFTFQQEVGERLGSLLRPDETFWNLGEDNTLYVAARRSPPTGILYIDPFIMGDEIDKFCARLLQDLNRASPALVIVSMQAFRLVPTNSPIFPWLRAHYVQANTGKLGRPTYQLFVRRDSDLRRRLNGAAPTTSHS